MSHTEDDHLEDLLRRHSVSGPTPELRQRVMSLRAGRSFFWEAAAASLLVGACLAQVVSTRPPVRLSVAAPADISEIREVLRQDFSEEQVQLATMSLHTSAGLIPLSPSRPGGRHE